MKATFFELTPFRNGLSSYLTDEQYRALQVELMNNPDKGDVIKHTGGLRKVRLADPRRQKGKGGGLRVIYYHWGRWCAVLDVLGVQQGRDDDLSTAEAKQFAELLRIEIESRTSK